MTKMTYKTFSPRGLLNRLLQLFARSSPGATTLRVWLHRLRGVKVGKDVWIGYDVIIDTAYPFLVSIGDRASIGIRASIIAHFKEARGVRIEEDAVLGPGVIVLPNVTVGRGAVVTAGSVVTQSVAPMTVVQGNPARAIARVSMPFGKHVSLKEFTRSLKPLR